MPFRKTAFALFILLLVVANIFGQKAQENEKPTIFDWCYAPGELLEIEIQTNLDSLVEFKMTNSEVEGVVTLRNNHEESAVLPAKLRARGRFRRRLCDFPPVKIDFDKDDLEDMGLKKTDDYKLVTHCFNSRAGDENVLKEYLTYRLYQQLTEKSFRVQLLKIRYLNEKGRKKATAYGFLIENEDEIAERLNSELIEDRYNVSRDSLEAFTLDLHDLFQYAVSNTDWNLPMVRNMKLFWRPADQEFFVVPYDFDFSGLVNTDYALPNADLGQKNVRERHFMGAADSPEELADALALMRSNRERLRNMIMDFEPLSKSERKDMVEYLDSFYESLTNGAFKADLMKE